MLLILKYPFKRRQNNIAKHYQRNIQKDTTKKPPTELKAVKTSLI